MIDDTVLALDLALLLPPSPHQMVKTLNRTLSPPPDGFYFDSTHLPHITIAQQFAYQSHVEEMCSRINKVILATKPLKLCFGEISRSGSACTLGINSSPALTEFHAQLLECLTPFVSTSGKPDAFWNDNELPRNRDIEYVHMFRRRSAFSSFSPHVTLGVGSINIAISQSDFIATKVALCQLGRFCTCRRVLASWALKEL